MCAERLVAELARARRSHATADDVDAFETYAVDVYARWLAETRAQLAVALRQANES